MQSTVAPSSATESTKPGNRSPFQRTITNPPSCRFSFMSSP
ncbi:unnamed protein product [Callosobruchus maculatus]|uniref:Uncharacterized protein n=1 Tax=Callosobruchus maculatus TaxID=64391 RepID=A0A653BKL5_CALMS|nr:unnamed protein product [Callosobruchus maculatus]